jgi:hypothetical protein
MFRCFFCLKFFQGASKVVGGAYLVLQDGMVSEYKTVPLNSSMKGWKSKWFYAENVEDGISTDIYSSTKPNPN